MLSTPFCSQIIHYEPPRGFLVPKFSTYDGSSDPFDHIMHYRQLMTLDIGNDALLCKVFPASLQGQALSWFHRLPSNYVGNFRDLSEAFVGQYLCSARHKQNISTLQNIKMQDNKSLREFVKRFGQAILQVEACSMDAPKNLLQRWTTCSDVPKNIQCSKMTYGRPPSKSWLLDRHLEVAQKEMLNLRTGQGRPIGGRKGRICVFLKEHGHTTETCRCLHYLVEKLIKAGHLKQYLRSDAGGRDASQNHNSRAPRASAATKAKLLRAASIRERINSIRPGLTGGGPRPINGTIIFPPVDPTRTLQPHRDALILSLEIGDFDVRRILVDPGSSTDLVQASVVSHMGHSLTGLENPGRILSGFNGSSTTSLGDIVLQIQAGPITLNVQFSVVQELSPFNIILGRTCLHYMKVIPSTYHKMVSFLTNDGQIDLYGSQLAARQCY
uniref:Retrotransposon gag domain-containing protein n=1 Tax=Vitis vinifera TaxID=29760 RepID=A5APT5_VITVI|nr:hypothetical protein VITISV_002495 [Vitis vinifera]